MSSLKIYKASAGSGKTFALTVDYLSLLLERPEAYRHILAVTFTNKAAGEMKKRILGRLHLLSKGHEDAAKEAALLQERSGLSADELKERSGLLLRRILNDYSAFSVGTIDRFFQSVIRAFTREIGIQPTYKLELDAGRVLSVAVDRMFQGLGENEELQNWLVRFAESRLSEERSWNARSEMISLGGELFKESFQGLFEYQDLDRLGREALAGLRKELETGLTGSQDRVKLIGQKALGAMQKAGVEVADFKNGQRGVAGMFTDALEGEIKLSDSRRAKLEAPEDWLKKSNSEADRQLVISTLIPLGKNLYDEMVVQNSLKAVRSYFFTLGILSDMWRSVREYSKERNLFLIGDSSRFLKGIIADSQVPFIYERTGNRYRHIMLDEFQDTSRFQYENFRPLLENGVSQGFENLVVGDVKQAIYRWRNSDWKILGSAIEEDLSHFAPEIKTLEFNYRSHEEVIRYNNDLFSRATELLALQMASELKGSALDEQEAEREVASFRRSYSDAVQKPAPGKEGSGGRVRMHFFSPDDREEGGDVLDRLPHWIADLQDRGLKEGQIAILVRNSGEGAAVAERLLAFSREGGRSFRIISNDSLLLVNSLAINFLMGVFKYSLHPEDKVNAALIRHLYLELKGREDKNCFQEDAPLEDYFPSTFFDRWEGMKQRPAFELCEELIGIFSLDERSEDLPYLQAFQDLLLDRQRKDTGSLSGFLDYWDEFASKHSISVSEAGNAIRIMTIHKAKGLEFEAVIIPFCSWSLTSEAHHENILWCATEATPLTGIPYVPVKYRSDLIHSWFAPWYYREKIRSYMDNLNLLYVACTRARAELIMGVPLRKKDVEAGPGGAPGEMKRAGELLVGLYYQGEKLREFGSPVAGEETVDELDWEFSSYPVNMQRSALRMRTRNDRFFLGGEQGREVAGPQAYGNLMHEIFSALEAREDLGGALDDYVREGILPLAERPALEDYIREKLADPRVESWFDGHARVFNERSLLCSDGSIRRPDRVMMDAGGTIVVDLKFGSLEKGGYHEQVAAYMKLLREMGHPGVRGYLWYVVLNKVEEVQA